MYPIHEFLFMFDNATGNSIHTKDALQIVYINKKSGGQQHFSEQVSIYFQMGSSLL